MYQFQESWMVEIKIQLQKVTCFLKIQKKPKCYNFIAEDFDAFE